VSIGRHAFLSNDGQIDSVLHSLTPSRSAYNSFGRTNGVLDQKMLGNLLQPAPQLSSNSSLFLMPLLSPPRMQRRVTRRKTVYGACTAAEAA
jgi:hypothetical protein